MSKFHFKKMMNEANKAKKAMVNQIKHDLVYGNSDNPDNRLWFLMEIGESFYTKYRWIESQRRQGLRIA